MNTPSQVRFSFMARTCALLLAVGFIGVPTIVSAQGFKFLEIKVVDPDGKPMADVQVDISLQGMAFPMPTDDKGMVSFNVPGGGRTQLTVKHDGYVAKGVSWNEGQTVPESFTIAMEKGVAIGGIVHDEEGKPIEGAKIEGIMVFNNSTQLPGKGELRPFFYGELATTDKEGRWRLNSAPEEKIELQLKYSHPEYVSDMGYGFRGGTWEQLRSLVNIVVMQKGLGVAGTVVDSDRKPIAGAKVGLGSDYVNDDMKTVTDHEGKYRINNVQTGSNVLTVFSRSHAPDVRNVSITKDMEPEDFELKPGQAMAFHVTDPDGKPVQGVGIAADTWRGTRGLMTLADRGSTDADGNWTWEHAPTDEVQIDMFCRGHMSVRGQNFIARTEPHEVTMPKALKVSGKVTDAVTRQPILTFSVVQGMKWDSTQQPVYWERYNIKQGQAGQYSTEFDEPREGHLIRIEVDGYRPGVSRIIKSDEQDVTLDFELVKGMGPTGVVKLPDGKPAAGVDVIMTTADSNQIQISNGKYNQQEAAKVTTDAEGKFKLPFSETDYRLVCLGDAGWGEIEGTPDSDNLEIVLEPWGKVEGVVMRGERPLPNEQVYLNFSDRNYQQGRPNVYWSYHATTDGAGKFAFDRARSGTAAVSRQIKYGEMGGSWMNASSHSKSVTTEPGETSTVQLGGKGRTIKGQLTTPENYKGIVNWNMGAVQMYESNQPQGPKGIFQAMGRAIAQATAPPAQPQQFVPRSYAATIDEDGKFEVFDMKPGNYQLSLQLYGVQNNQRAYPPQGTLQQQITVPEGAEEESVDVGKFEIKMTEPALPPSPTATLQLQAIPVPVPAE